MSELLYERVQQSQSIRKWCRRQWQNSKSGAHV
jgi:hypothetical protein